MTPAEPLDRLGAEPLDKLGAGRLVRGCIARDERAWEELVGRYGRLVRYVIRETLAPFRPGRAEQDIDDLVGEFFAGLLKDDCRALRGLRDPGSLKSYLGVAARRRAIDFGRARKPDPVSLDGMRPDETSAPGSGIAALAAEARADRTQTSLPPVPPEIVARVMEALPEKERDLVRLCYLENMKYREAAGKLGISPNSVGPTLARALGRMQKSLAEIGVKVE